MRGNVRVLEKSIGEQAGVQSHGKVSGFPSKCGEELLEGSGKGINVSKKSLWLL